MSTLGTLIYNKLQTVPIPTPSSGPTVQQDFAEAIAAAVMQYLQSNVTVLPGTFVSPVGPVTGVGLLNPS